MAKSDVVDAETGEVVQRFYNGRPHLDPGVDASHDGRTKSEHEKGLDIAERVKLYQERGVLPGMRQPAGPQHDVDHTIYPESYHDALSLVARVNQAFLDLPSEIRTKFHNDPKLYLADLEAQHKAVSEAQAKARSEAAEAVQYDIEDRLASGRSKASARAERVKQAMTEPVSPPKEG